MSVSIVDGGIPSILDSSLRPLETEQRGTHIGKQVEIHAALHSAGALFLS